MLLHKNNHKHTHHKHASRLKRAQAPADIDAALQSAACTYLLASGREEEEQEEEHIQDLLAVQELITVHRYLSREDSAGRHNIDILEAYIHEYPEPACLHSRSAFFC